MCKEDPGFEPVHSSLPPAGPDHPNATAGANFQLPYRARFLIPHHRSAWLRFAERLDELATFVADLRLSGGT